jgi:uncharacterized alpha-E superfamily protein
VVDTLSRVRNSQSTSTQSAALRLLSELRDLSIEEIFEKGLHLYLTEFLSRINSVGSGISQDFLLPLQVHSEVPVV